MPQQWFKLWYSGIISLIVLYINDLANSSDVLSFRPFADDANIFYATKTSKDLEAVMNSELQKVINYCIIVIILLKFKFNGVLNLHNPHIASLIEAGCVTYNKIHYKCITLQIHYIIVKGRKKKYMYRYIIIKIS